MVVVRRDLWPNSSWMTLISTPVSSKWVAKPWRLCRMRHRRHTFATEMLRSGVSLPALMKLLGHSTPKMTLLYAEITQADLQREFHLARSHPRHLVPPPKLSVPPSGPQADLPGVLHSLQAAQHVVEMFRRSLP